MPTSCRNINSPISFTYARGGPVITGAVTLSNLSLTLGIGSSASNLDLELVYNACIGGTPQIPQIGRAVRLTCGSLSFGGIINSRSYSESSSGISYKFKIIDPRKILENVSVMLRDYYCPLAAPNFINVLPFIEQGVAVCPPGNDTHNWPRVGGCGNFGRSGGANGTYIKSVLQAIQGNGIPVYTTTGEALSLNLGNVIAVCPQYAKTDGVSTSLLSLIAQACDEGGCDFTVTLEGTAVTVWVINRNIQPQFGLIQGIIANAQSSGTLISGEIGEEELYENANKVVIGEKVSYMTTVPTRGTAAMMLGHDEGGNPIRVFNAGFRVPVNISSLAESLYSLSGISLPYMFPLSEEEILCAGSVELWKLYGTIRPNSLSGVLMEYLGIRQKMSTVYNSFMRLMQGGQEAASDLNTVNRSPRFAAKEPKVVIYELAYKWLTDWIAEWYGKKWLIPINGFCVNPAPMTNVISDGGMYYMSDAPADAGWPNQVNLLGLIPGVDTTIFESSDNKLSGFIALQTNSSLPRNIYGRTIDFVLSPDGLSGDYLVKGGTAYVKVNTDGPVYRRTGTVADVLISTPFIGMTPRLQTNLLSFGLTALACLTGNEQTLKSMELRSNGYSDITSSNIYKMGFATAGFDFATIPMRSNVYVYGPWVGSRGPIGGTEVLTTNLSPWNYGNEAIMSMVGQSLADNGVRLANSTESGSMTLAEPPGYSVQYFLAAGIVINSININYNSGGATTNYNFQTYSAKFGQYGKALADSVRDAIKARNEIFTFIKEQRRRTVALTNTMRNSFSRATSINTFRPDTRSSINSASPGNVLVGGYTNPAATKKIIEIGLNSKKEYETAIEGPNFQNLAIMSLDGLFMPVSLQGRNNYLPRYVQNFAYERGDKSRKSRPSMPPLNGDQDNPQKASPINQTYLNPILSVSLLNSYWTDGRGRSSSTSIQALSFGMNTPDQDLYGPVETKYDNVEDFGFYALRGPLVLQSWGYDTENKPIPNSVDSPSQAMGGTFNHQNTTNKFMTNWLAQPETWPIGPVDLRFDRDRGVWVCPPPDRILLAELTAELKESGCVQAKLLNSSTSSSVCTGQTPFYSNYTVYGNQGESIIDTIENQKITVYNYLNNITLASGEKIYAVYNDDKYLALPKGGGSNVRVGKFSGSSWNKFEAKTVDLYKVDSANAGGVNLRTNPSTGYLSGDGDAKPMKALNLFADIENSGGGQIWVAVADIGSDFNILIAAECVSSG